MMVWSEQVLYCSRFCYYESKKKHVTKNCSYCGKEFEITNSIFRTKFCSRACFGKAERKPLPMCEKCGKPCTKHARRFCSRQCKVDWFHGERVWNYTGWDGRIRYDITVWEKLSKEIRERDKVCKHCGKTPKQNGKSLDVHHIIPFRFSKDNSPLNLVALCAVCHKKAEHKYLSENNLYKNEYNTKSKS